MPVIYNSNALIPAPFFSCSKEYQTADDGTILGKTYHIQLKGKTVAWSGSPNSTGTFWTGSGYPPDEVFDAQHLLAAHIKKQEAIRTLFATPGQTLEVMALDGSVSLRCNPRILSVDTPEGNWTTTADYIITMECDVLYVNSQEDDVGIQDTHIVKASEEWNMEVVDEHLMTYRLSHAVNAIGKTFYAEDGSQPKKPWEYAKDYVLNTISLGIDTSKMTAAGVIDDSSLAGYNYLRGQSLNELTGSFSVNETWLCYDGGSAYEEFSVNTRTSIEGRTSVAVNGTITGLAVYDNATHTLSQTRAVSANAKWATVTNTLFTRAQTQSGITLNPVVLTKDFGQNQVAGTITYNYEYDDRPTALISGAKSTHLTQTDDNAVDVFASIPVVGRKAGPILQPIGTVTSKKRIMALTAQMGVATFTNPTLSKPASDTIFSTYIPTASQVFIDQDQESWERHTGQYSRTVSYTYQ